MEGELASRDRKPIEESIQAKFAKVAISPKGLFRYPTGLAGLKALSYCSEIIQALPEAVSASYCGVGNPFSLRRIREGRAIPGKDFLALIQQAGFTNSELVGETGFNSSVITKGVLLRATKV